MPLTSSVMGQMMAGAIISDGDLDRKRGVHAAPCVVPKNLFLEKISPPFTSKTRADTRKFA